MRKFSESSTNLYHHNQNQRTSSNDVIAQTREFLGAQAEIFSDEDAARRWYWYARAQGFLVPRY